MTLAAGMGVGEVEELEVVGAIREREALRARLEAWDLAVRELDRDPALIGRR